VWAHVWADAWVAASAASAVTISLLPHGLAWVPGDFWIAFVIRSPLAVAVSAAKLGSNSGAIIATVVPSWQRQIAHSYKSCCYIEYIRGTEALRGAAPAARTSRCGPARAGRSAPAANRRRSASI